MKLQPINNSSLKTHGIKKTVKFGIKSSGLAHIFNVLRNQLYSDKITAVIREYTCNGIDAHVEDNKSELPITVTLPNRLNPNFKVRDYGKALSDEEISEVYAFYGESTKRTSNNQIGMIGIGSKSAFAYGDNFVIHSYLNGKKHIYNAFIDPSQVGQITKLGVEETKEENGVEIIVPVKGDDHDEFREKAETLFKWYEVRPTIKGVKEFSYNDNDILFSGDDSDWEWTDGKQENGYYHSGGECVAVMGNIGYPVSWYNLNISGDRDLQKLTNKNLVLRFDIGDLEISASREKLQYTDYTRESIIARLKKVEQELADKVSETFNDCETLFDARCLYGSVFDYGSGLYQLRDIISKKLQWKGKQITDSNFTVHPSSGYHDIMKIHHYKKGSRGGRYRGEEAHYISCKNDTVVVLNDMGHRRGIMGRLLPLIIEEGKDVYLADFQDDVTKKKWMAETNFDGKCPKMSELECRKLTDFYGKSTKSDGSSYAKDSKHTTKEFIIDWDKVENGNSWDRAKSGYYKEDAADIKNDSGVYVIIDKFEIEGNVNGSYKSDSHPQQLKCLKEKLEKIGIDLPTKLYAFKKVVRSKVEGKDNWTNLFVWLEKELKKTMVEKKLVQKYVDRIHALESNPEELPDAGSKGHILLKEKVVKPDSEILDFLRKMEMMLHPTWAKAIDAFNEVVKNLDFKDLKLGKGIKPTHDLKFLGRKVLGKYSMLVHAGRYAWGYDFERRTFGKDVVNYINVVDITDSGSWE